jgi:hypothetical protein
LAYPIACKPKGEEFTDQKTLMSVVLPCRRKDDMSGHTATSGERPQHTVVDISRLVYGLLPASKNGYVIQENVGKGHNTRQSRRTLSANFNEIDTARQAGTALVAQAPLYHPDVKHLTPVVFNIRGQSSSDRAFESNISGRNPVDFAIWLEFSDGQTTTLPLAIDIIGGRTGPRIPTSKTRGETMITSSFSWDDDDETGLALQEFFGGFPILRVSDTTLLHLHPSTTHHLGHVYIHRLFWDIGKWERHMTSLADRILDPHPEPS